MAQRNRKPKEKQPVHYTAPTGERRLGIVVSLLSSQFIVKSGDRIDFVFYTDDWEELEQVTVEEIIGGPQWLLG